MLANVSDVDDGLQTIRETLLDYTVWLLAYDSFLPVDHFLRENYKLNETSDFYTFYLSVLNVLCIFVFLITER